MLVGTIFLNPLFGQTVSTQLLCFLFTKNDNSMDWFYVGAVILGIVAIQKIVEAIRPELKPPEPSVTSLICNYIKNENGYEDNNESSYFTRDRCVGIKNEFRVGVDQNITFAGRTNNASNQYLSEFALKIWTPSGIMLEKVSRSLGNITGHSQCLHPSRNVEQLYNKGGEGKWVAKWYISDRTQSVDTFIIKGPIIPPPPPPPKWNTPKILSYRNINKICLNASSDELYNYLMEELVHYGPWKVVTRTELDKVLKEQDLQFGSRFDQTTSVRIGKLLGADVIIEAHRNGDYKGILRILDVQEGTYLEFVNIKTSRYRSNNDEWLTYSMIPYLLEHQITEKDKNGDIYSLTKRASSKK
jgi:hypothetical protein